MIRVTSAKWESVALLWCSCPELHGGIGLIVQQPLDPSELAFRVLADAIGDLGVLALDDRPHASPLGRRPVSRVSGSDAGGRVADRPDRVYPVRPGRPGSAFAGDGDRARPRRPGRDRAPTPQAARVAPVVTTSSTSRTQRPATARRRAPAARRTRNAPATLVARSSRPSSNWAIVARPRSRARTTGRPELAPRRPPR